MQRVLVGPGAIAVVLSGVVRAMPYMRSGAMPGWLNLMMAAGLLGALAAVGISVPAAARLARLELGGRGEMPEAFQGLRKRPILAASIAGGLGLVPMAAGAILMGEPS